MHHFLICCEIYFLSENWPVLLKLIPYLQRYMGFTMSPHKHSCKMHTKILDEDSQNIDIIMNCNIRTHHIS